MKIKFPLFFFLLPLVFAELQVGFYKSTCPQAESIVQQVIQTEFCRDPSITAALLRMHFHDCFVTGCDASILIDSTRNKPSEKAAGPNLTVRGFEVIDNAKKRLEAACPSIVSCADIITLATRDAIALAGGPNYTLPTGRRDGLVSNPDDVLLPGPGISVSGALQVFTAKGMALSEMVTLLGAHTVGIAHCFFFDYRLSNYEGSGAPDPSMDPGLVAELNVTCARNENATAFLDQSTSLTMDNEYFKQILLRKGILQIDQELALDRSTAGIVSGFASDRIVFQRSFAKAMRKLGSVQVLVGKAGEIRKNCRVFNTATKSTKEIRAF
uniref:Peroxidase n=1 Tax=Betula platyphylla TaxID=78630 RepID=A0A0H4CUQ3_BETPL|nr:peroxidase 9 [Betula platyphylla]